MRNSPFVSVLALPLVLGSAFGCAPPRRDLPPDQIDKLGTLSEVMDVQATVSDPQFKKIDAASYSDEDWAAFLDMGNRLQATSRKALQFSKGPEFDAFANQLHTNAEKLATVAAAKDAKAASDTLASIKATCKACHSKFR